MTRWCLLPLFSIALAIPIAPGLAHAQVTSYVLVSTGGQVRLIDAATGMPVDPPIDTLGVHGGELLVTPDGRHAILAEHGEFGNVAFLDVVTRTPIERRYLPSSEPDVQDGIASPDGTRFYVTGQEDGLFIIDVATRAMRNPLPIGCRARLAIAPDSRTLYCTDGDGVDVVDVERETVITHISVPNTRDIAIAPDGLLAYVSSATENDFDRHALTPLDLRSNTPLPSIEMTQRPDALAISPDSRFVYVAHPRDHTVSVIEVRTQSVVATVDVGGPAHGFAVTPDGAAVYVGIARGTTTPIIDVIAPTSDAPTWRVTRALDIAGALGVSPPVIVARAAGAPLDIGGDADLTARGFGARLVTFDGGTLRLTGRWSTPRQLSVWPGGATIDTNGFDAILGGGVTALDGPLVKRGAGALVLSGVLPATGGMQVQGGTLTINGRYAGTVAIGTGATLAGDGDLGAVLATAGSTISPGLDRFGSLEIGDLFMAPGSTLAVDIGAGFTSDQIDVRGVATIDRATLAVRVGLTLPRVGETYTVAAPVQGTFAGLPQGSVLATPDALFRIDYAPLSNGRHAVGLRTLDVRPVVSRLSDQTIDRNTVLGPLAFTIGDAPTAPEQLIVTASSSNPGLVPPENLLLAGTGAARSLTVTPSRDQSGTTLISVTVSDGTFSVTARFSLTVSAPPPPPPPPPPTELTYFLAEGATGVFFDTFVLIANPHSTETAITLTFFKEGGASIIQTRTLAPMSRTTIRVDDIAGLEDTAVATQVTSPADKPIIVERTMRWDASGYGAHTEKATAGAARQWYFAEGSQGFFTTYILLQNPHATTNRARITYLREGAAPVVREYPLAPASRRTVEAGADPELVDTSFGARVEFDEPGVAERAMYFGGPRLFSGGHGAVGVTAPAARWFFAEGATGSFFSTYILLANPNDADTTVTLTYLPATSPPIVKRLTIGTGRRHTITLADEDPSLTDAAVAIQVEADRPIVAERAQYWPNPTWNEAHDSFGVTEAATRWGLAEGRVGGSDAAQTYILLANPGTQEATVTVTFLRETGAPLVKQFIVPPERRFNVPVVGPSGLVPELTDEVFGAIIDSTRPIVVERSLYTNANGVTWAAGTNATATRLP